MQVVTICVATTPSAVTTTELDGNAAPLAACILDGTLKGNGSAIQVVRHGGEELVPSYMHHVIACGSMKVRILQRYQDLVQGYGHENHIDNGSCSQHPDSCEWRSTRRGETKGHNDGARLSGQQAYLNDVLKCLSLNGYSVFSLIDDLLAQGCNQEDPRIKLLREGVERDAASICARLLNHNPTSASVSAWALGFAQAMTMTLPLWKNNVVSHGLSPGVAWTSTGSPERFLNMGRVLHNVFLEIFDFCLRDSTMYTTRVIQPRRKWQILIHVCQRWRRIIFESPRRLDLHLRCSYGTPVRRNLGSWPVTLPLAVDYAASRLTHGDEDSVIYALRRTGRVHRVKILAPCPLLGKVAAVMQKSFPMLTHLDLAFAWDHERDVPPVIPERFLGGSAPSLQCFRLERVSFPQLPTFLPSARNLITLKVEDIFQNGYISPEDMVGGLAVLIRLRILSVTFDEGTPEERTDCPDPPMRITLPALTAFHFRGHSKYLEDFLAQIDMPLLDDLRIEYFSTYGIQATQLTRFLDRTKTLKLDQFNRARITFSCDIAHFKLDSNCPQGERHHACLTLELLNHGWLDSQVPSVARVLGQLVPTFSNVDHLDAHGDDVDPTEMDVADWLPFFRLFSAVESLHLSGGIAGYIVSALEDTANSEEMVTNVFPELHLIWLDEMDNEDCDEPVGSIERFLAMRQLTGFPVTVVDTEDEFYRN
ncbi:hypothetical protein EDB89DRAFT_2248278 [Lactarius sanguifluus]|nr:hypothetical protein EDB89DRAFT_2248278 [Lactarius sanguifluus]